jgi:hypothetical protein
MVIEPYVVYKAIYNYSFLDKEFLYPWYMYANDEGAMRSAGVSPASLWPNSYISYYIVKFLLKYKLYNI